MFLPEGLLAWISAGATGCITLYLLKSGVDRLKAEIRFERGASSAAAKVLRITDSGMQAGGANWLNLSLEVHCGDSSSAYVVLLSEQAAMVRMHKVSVGGWLHVRANPALPDKIVVLWGEPLPAGLGLEEKG